MSEKAKFILYIVALILLVIVVAYPKVLVLLAIPAIPLALILFLPGKTITPRH